MPKWIEETVKIVLEARKSKFLAPQTVLIGRGARYRTLLYRARLEGDGKFCCEFLAIDEVGGPAVGLKPEQLALLTGIRMGFRFRSEVIRKLRNELDMVPQEDRKTRILEIARTIDNLEVESNTRGDISEDTMLMAFDDDEDEAERIQKLFRYWPTLKVELYRSLGLSDDGKTVLGGPNVDRFHIAFKALDLMNVEFLTRCCARIPKMMTKTEDQLSANAKVMEEAMATLTKPELKAVA